MNSAWPALITLLTVVLMIGTAMLVGKARGKYGVKAPASSGHPMFDRAFRVQMNTIEGALMFLPALWVCALWGNGTVVIVAGVLWLLGRVHYAYSYMRDPAKRGPGFGMCFLSTVALLIGSAIGLARALFA